MEINTLRYLWLLIALARTSFASYESSSKLDSREQKPFFRRNFRKGFSKVFNRLVNAGETTSADESGRSSVPPNASPFRYELEPFSGVLSGLKMARPLSMAPDGTVILEAKQELFDSPGEFNTSQSDSPSPIRSTSEKMTRSRIVVPMRRTRSLTPSIVGDRADELFEPISSSGSSTPLSARDVALTPVEYETTDVDIMEKYRIYIAERNVRDIAHKDLCTPNLTITSYWDTVGSGRRIHMSSLLYASRMSTVFAISGSNDLVAKYQSDCFEFSKDTNHPLVKDYFVYSELKDMGISPRAFYVSPPSGAWPEAKPHRQFAKVGFTMSQDEYTKCSKSLSKVRYLIMEKMGDSIAQLIRSGILVGFYNSIMMGIEMMEAIRLLHVEKKIIHGDVHQGNFVLHRGQIKVIDFGRFEFLPVDNEESGADDRAEFIRPPFKRNHPFFSHWEIAGYTNTRRDDVFKVLMVVGALMNGNLYNEYIFNDIVGDAGLSFTAKAYKNVFGLKDLSSNMYVKDPLLELSNLNTTVLENIRSRLRTVLKTTRALEWHEEPDYKLIISNLCTIKDLIVDYKIEMIVYDGRFASSLCLTDSE